jgi:cytochrome bd ubiquinol oxidase subunit I
MEFDRRKIFAVNAEVYMHVDIVTLSRIFFGLTIMFHYIFPPLTIGLGLFMVVVECLYIKTKDPLYKDMALFWTKIFAANFAVGVATGIVMEFEFGTNWATYSRYVGDVFGSALAAEGIFAFFLESGFLAVLVFGWDKVSPRMHFFSTCMVSLGSIFSSIWITIANSWMQTPAGYHLVKQTNGFVRAEITDFWQLVFNPSSVNRLVHVWIAAAILGAFFVLSIASFYLLKKRHEEFAKRTILLGLIYAAVASCSELGSGHFQADGVAVNQPAKLAAFECHYKTGTGGTEMYIVGWPNKKTEKVDCGIALPGMLSILVHNDPNKPVTGLDQIPVDERPPVVIPFISYHIMVACGMMFIGSSLLGLFLYWRGSLFRQKWLLWCFVFMVLGAFAANETGWVSAEVGRQPWIVYGLLKTKNAVSTNLREGEVWASILMFSTTYAFLFAVWVYVINNKIQHGPEGLAAQVQALEYKRIAEDGTEIKGGDRLIEVASRMFKHGEYSLTETISVSPKPPADSASA